MDTRFSLNYPVYWLAIGSFLGATAAVVVTSMWPLFDLGMYKEVLITCWFVIGGAMVFYSLTAKTQMWRFYLSLVLVLAGIVLMSSGGVRSWESLYAVCLVILLCIAAGIAMIWAVIAQLRMK